MSANSESTFKAVVAPGAEEAGSGASCPSAEVFTRVSWWVNVNACPGVGPKH